MYPRSLFSPIATRPLRVEIRYVASSPPATVSHTRTRPSAVLPTRSRQAVRTGCITRLTPKSWLRRLLAIGSGSAVKGSTS
jgi:hypothetical protein